MTGVKGEDNEKGPCERRDPKPLKVQSRGEVTEEPEREETFKKEETTLRFITSWSPESDPKKRKDRYK